MFLSPTLALTGCVVLALAGCGGVSEQALHVSASVALLLQIQLINRAKLHLEHLWYSDVS